MTNIDKIILHESRFNCLHLYIWLKNLLKQIIKKYKCEKFYYDYFLPLYKRIAFHKSYWPFNFISITWKTGFHFLLFILYKWILLVERRVKKFKMFRIILNTYLYISNKEIKSSCFLIICPIWIENLFDRRKNNKI